MAQGLTPAYAARKASGIARGLTVSQTRGHAGIGQLPITLQRKAATLAIAGTPAQRKQEYLLLETAKRNNPKLTELYKKAVKEKFSTHSEGSLFKATNELKRLRSRDDRVRAIEFGERGEVARSKGFSEDEEMYKTYDNLEFLDSDIAYAVYYLGHRNLFIDDSYKRAKEWRNEFAPNALIRRVNIT